METPFVALKKARFCRQLRISCAMLNNGLHVGAAEVRRVKVANQAEKWLWH